jgi:thiamine biosynthesis protein ThiI
MTKVLVRYGELGLKSERVMRRFLKRLNRDMTSRLTQEGIDHVIGTERGRIFVDCNDPGRAIEVLRRVSGVFSLSEVTECGSSRDQIMECLADYGRDRVRPGMSYGLKVKRIGSHPYTSRDIAIAGGGAVVSHLKEGESRVDLDDPDIWIELEIRENRTYIFSGRVKGVGGMPSDTQGKVLLYLPPDRDKETEERAALSYWMLSRRGCTVIPVSLPEAGSEWMRALQTYGVRAECMSLEGPDVKASLARTCTMLRAAGIAYPFDVSAIPSASSVHPRDGPLAEFYPTAGIERGGIDAMLERFS